MRNTTKLILIGITLTLAGFWLGQVWPIDESLIRRPLVNVYPPNGYYLFKEKKGGQIHIYVLRKKYEVLK